MQHLLLAALSLLSMAGCRGGSDASTQGVLIPIPATLSLKANPTVAALSSTEGPVTVEFEPTPSAGGSSLSFRVAGLVSGTRYLFRVSSPEVDPLLGFPFEAGGIETLKLAALQKGTVAAAGTLAVSAGLIPSVQGGLAIVMGQVNPTGQGDCRSISRVTLLDAQGLLVGSAFPVYFDNSGMPVAGAMADTQCSYAFFNVPPGSYRVAFFTALLAKVGEHDVEAQAGETSFGVGIPQ